MKAPAGDYRTPGQPSIFQVTREKFIPTLLPSELEKIDNTVARGNYSTKKKDDKPSVRDQVGGQHTLNVCEYMCLHHWLRFCDKV